MIRSPERAGRLKGQKCGSLAVIYATLGCSAASCSNSCGEIKLTLNNTAARDPPTSVATFFEHLRAGRTLLDSSIDARCLLIHGDEWLEASLESKFAAFTLDQGCDPLRLRQSYNLKSDLCQQAYDFDTLYHLQNSFLTEMSQSAVVSPYPGGASSSMIFVDQLIRHLAGTHQKPTDTNAGPCL